MKKKYCVDKCRLLKYLPCRPENQHIRALSAPDSDRSPYPSSQQLIIKDNSYYARSYTGKNLKKLAKLFESYASTARFCLRGKMTD